jgi:hypothetical protein
MVKVLTANEFLDFYSINQEEKPSYPRRGLPFDENDTIPLGFRSGIEGDFTNYRPSGWFI